MDKKSNFYNRLDTTIKNIKFVLSPLEEIGWGIYNRTLPWHLCGGWMIISTLILFFKIDYWLISKTHLKFLYPHYSFFYKLYALFFATFGFLAWGFSQANQRNQNLKKLTYAFRNASLVSNIGRIPNLISDYPIDSVNRKLKVTNAGFPLKTFQEKSNFLASELGIHIDSIKENRERRSIEIIYSHIPMIEEYKYGADLSTRPLEFIVGRTRANLITTNFSQQPHLLIAGQTGGGKSTFLRQLIVHTHLNMKSASFLMIDLKGGLEFSLFENRKQFTVVPSVTSAIEELKKIDKILEERMSLLKSNDCKDIESYLKKKEKDSKLKFLNRQFVVVDEAAEMFLAGHHASSKDIQVARSVLSRIARQGRAVGAHLIIATQRPDSKSLDPQVKANLTGVLCFQMMNDSSSIAVLGNGRATDLPKVAGRAIWKSGMDMLEVQTPLLGIDDAEKLLGPIEKTKHETATNVSDQIASTQESNNLRKEDFKVQKD